MDRSKLLTLVTAVLSTVLALAAYIISNGATTNFTNVEPTLTALALRSNTPTLTLTASPTITNMPLPTNTIAPTPTKYTPQPTPTPITATATLFVTPFGTPPEWCKTDGWCFTPEKAFYVVNVTVLNVRDQPSTSANRVGTKANGARIFIRCVLDKRNGEIWLSEYACGADGSGRTWLAATLDGKTFFMVYDPNQD